MNRLNTTILLLSCVFINEISNIQTKSTSISSELSFKENENEIISDNKMNNVHEYRENYVKKIKTFMNQTRDPCDDFYEYACGNWKNVIEKRPLKQKRNNLLEQSIQIRDAIEKILTKVVDNETQVYASELKIVQQFYASCLAAELVPRKKSDIYLKVLNSIGGFPALDANWQAAKFNWFNMSSHLSKYGINSLINEQIVPQYPFAPIFEIPILGFSHVVNKFNINSNKSDTYLENWKNMETLLRMYNVEEYKIHAIITDIFKFWHEVLKVYDTFQHDLETCLLVSEMLATKPFEQWQNYFIIGWEGTTFEEMEAHCPCDYLYEQLDLISKNSTAAVANYLALKFLHIMHADIEDRKYQQEFCIFTAHKSLAFVIDDFYMKDNFHAHIRQEVMSILNKLRANLRNTLQELDWFDESTRKEALLKESTLIVRVGRYEDTNITDRIIRETRNLVFNASNYEENNLSLKRFSQNITRYLGKNKLEIANNTKPLEIMIGSQVNAFYYNDDNSINVMAGVLHPPSYHANWPDSLKYGTLGFLIGHELTHSTDSNFDSKGKLRNWWSKKSTQIYKERANCFIKHYDNYLIPEIKHHMDGNVTKDENIADAHGLREAFNAYRREKKLQLHAVYKNADKVLDDDVLPNFNLTSEQLFFLGFAQLWCAAYDERHYWEELTMPHSIDKYRVLGAVTNNEDFSKAYNCPIGSKMNPQVEKCRLW